LFAGRRILWLLIMFSGSEVGGGPSELPVLEEAGMVVKMVKGSGLIDPLSVALADELGTLLTVSSTYETGEAEVDAIVLLPTTSVGTLPATPSVGPEIILPPTTLLPPGMILSMIPPRRGRVDSVEAGSSTGDVGVGTEIVEKIPASRSSARSPPLPPRRGI